MPSLAVVILAAGEGQRMRSRRPKILHELMGRPIIEYPVDLACSLAGQRIVVVVGVGADVVKERLKDRRVIFALQRNQRGTGHAALCAKNALRGFTGDVFIQYGDTPLLTKATIQKLVKTHRSQKAHLSLVTTHMPNPFGYGRIMRDARRRAVGIVEEPDCTAEQRRMTEVNPGIYLAKADFLFTTLPRIQSNNKLGEIYLTDLLELAAKNGRKIATVLAPDYRETLGINSRDQLAFAASYLRERVNKALMDSGVTIEDPAVTYIDPRAKIGPDTVIEPGVKIIGPSIIGRECIIQAHSRIDCSQIKDRVLIAAGSVIEESLVRQDSRIGPMAHLRPCSVVGKEVLIGNFVELKKARVGDRTKASHLTYLGDAEIGKDVNVGCGTITCNYDGIVKSKTIIADQVFVGSDSQLVAPVKVGKGAYIGSGSTITKDVPPWALALTRAPQVHKPGWAKKKKKQKKA